MSSKNDGRTEIKTGKLINSEIKPEATCQDLTRSPVARHHVFLFWFFLFVFVFLGGGLLNQTRVSLQHPEFPF